MKQRLTPRAAILLAGLALAVLIALTIGVSGALGQLGIIDPNDPYSLYWSGGVAVIVLAVVASLAQISGYSVKDLVGWARGREVVNPDFLPGSTRYKRNRKVMLQQVREFWIKGVFENSLAHSALLSLGMEHKPELVTRPWGLVIQSSGVEGTLVPPKTKIIELFDQAQGSLLILGAPGSGKTTTLLELARGLLDRAERDESHQMPVVFSLSTWSTQRLVLTEWLVEELHSQYNVPRDIGKAWVSRDLVLPLLDGLDEVRAEDRTRCLEAINEFRSVHSHGPEMVVCSRIDDYETMSTRLHLRGAVSLQPLTSAQIDKHLEPFDNKFAILRQLIHDRSDLRELATAPLLLGIMMVVFQNTTMEAPAVEDKTLAIEFLLERYARLMLERPTGIRVYVGSTSNQDERRRRPRYSSEQTRHWLGWVSRKMKQHELSMFFLEGLQPYWIVPSGAQHIVAWAAFALSGLIGALCGWLFGGPDGWRFVGTVGLLGGLPTGNGPVSFVTLVIGSLDGVFNLFRRVTNIELVESLEWRPLNVRLPLLPGSILGAFFGVGIGLTEGIVIGISAGLGTLIISVFLLSFAFGGLSAGQEVVPRFPGDGVKNSMRSGLYGSLLYSGLFVGLAIGLVFFVESMVRLGGGDTAQTITLNDWLAFGLALGLYCGLKYGWLAALQHAVLRLMLWRAGSTPRPWEYVRFLDYCADRVLLRKVGGGYIFIHRMLLEWFAKQPESA